MVDGLLYVNSMSGGGGCLFSEEHVHVHINSIQRARVSFLLQLCKDLLLKLYLNISSI